MFQLYKYQHIVWVVPPPSNSGKWRFIGIPYTKNILEVIETLETFTQKKTFAQLLCVKSTKLLGASNLSVTTQTRSLFVRMSGWPTTRGAYWISDGTSVSGKDSPCRARPASLSGNPVKQVSFDITTRILSIPKVAMRPMLVEAALGALVRRHTSVESEWKNGCLGYLGDEILPSYAGIMS